MLEILYPRSPALRAMASDILRAHFRTPASPLLPDAWWDTVRMVGFAPSPQGGPRLAWQVYRADGKGFTALEIEPDRPESHALAALVHSHVVASNPGSDRINRGRHIQYVHPIGTWLKHRVRVDGRRRQTEDALIAALRLASAEPAIGAAS